MSYSDGRFTIEIEVQLLCNLCRQPLCHWTWFDGKTGVEKVYVELCEDCLDHERE